MFEINDSFSFLFFFGIGRPWHGKVWPSLISMFSLLPFHISSFYQINLRITSEIDFSWFSSKVKQLQAITIYSNMISLYSSLKRHWCFWLLCTAHWKSQDPHVIWGHHCFHKPIKSLGCTEVNAPQWLDHNLLLAQSMKIPVIILVSDLSLGKYFSDWFWFHHLQL